MNDERKENNNMGRREGEKVTSSDVWKFILEHLKMLLVVSPVLTFIMLALWNVYAQPKVDITVKNQTEPLKLKIIKIENSQAQTQFDTKQILSILVKTTDPVVVNQVITETERFRPDNSRNEEQ